MNFGMWRKALQVIPRISKEEWNALSASSDEYYRTILSK